jgi:hypothetical protein
LPADLAGLLPTGLPVFMPRFDFGDGLLLAMIELPGSPTSRGIPPRVEAGRVSLLEED